MLKVAWDDTYVHPLPEGHRFPMEKYQLIKDQLLYEGTIQENIFKPGLIDEEMLLLTHSPGYWNKLKTLTLSAAEIRRIGFPLSAALVRREQIIAEGTRQTAVFALKYKISMNIAGGTHHAFTGRGEGFCLLNDIAMAANFLLEKGLVSKILIIDLDVHQGNGTAEVFINNPSVFTMSIHGANNFPARKEKSDLDIGLWTIQEMMNISGC
jgi:acetoin utilization deacetylase AcuC-like enzyme